MRVHSQDNRLVDDVLTFATNLVCQEINGLLYLPEVGEFLVRHLIELGPGLYVLWRVVETQLERTSCHYTVTSRKEVKAHDGLEYRRLAC